MALDIRYFLDLSNGTTHRAFLWDGVSLTDVRDFHAMYCTALPNAYVDPCLPLQGVGGDPVGYVGVLWFYFLDENEERQGNQIGPGTWIEVAPFGAENPNTVSGPGPSMIELPKPVGT